MSMKHATIKPESVSRKKSNSLCYHAVSESVEMKESLVEYLHSSENIENLMLKVTYRQKLASYILYDIYDFIDYLYLEHVG